MDKRLRLLLDKYHLQLVYLPIEGKGYIVPTKGDIPDQLIVNSNLPDSEVPKVVLHEIGHYIHDDATVNNYLHDYCVRIKSESTANQFMIRELIKEYVDYGFDAERVNYINLAQNLGIKNYQDVEIELSKYFIKEKSPDTEDFKS
ncbi:ImmA/IrrE family metallo-endopeptidase [Lactobacillus intestinalis]|uniref:ImmA/IrrE family metallo-endopeptidase n=1 Tax=Lactobacillus intestinalis TaxID=151781 RepID=UPI0027296A7C|nr:ImmA/IrrE family metallo-endopeptidase [Lactobacillus intestinalis]